MYILTAICTDPSEADTVASEVFATEEQDIDLEQMLAGFDDELLSAINDLISIILA